MPAENSAELYFFIQIGFVSVLEFFISSFVLKYVNAVLTLLFILGIVSFKIGYIYSLISFLVLPLPSDINSSNKVFNS